MTPSFTGCRFGPAGSISSRFCVLRNDEASTRSSRLSRCNRCCRYRRPIEARAESQRELTAIVQDVVVEQVAGLFNLPPGDLDPRYDDGA